MALGSNTIGRAKIILEADSKGVSRALRTAESEFSSATGKISRHADTTTKSFGRMEHGSHRLATALKVGLGAALGGIGAAVVGLGAAFKVGFDEMEESQRVAAQTAAVLKSTGGAANVTAKQVDALAQSLLRKSGIDDEVIKSGENMLLTFTGIRNEAGKGNDIFNQTTKVVTDMAVAMNGGHVNAENMRKTSILVGKALQDPIKGFTSLHRVGVNLNSSQQELIKHLVGTGHTMEAQKIILRELNKEFGGSAEAAGKTLPGQLNILKETFRNVAADVVAKMVPALLATINAISDAIPTIKAFGKATIEAFKVAVDAVKEFSERIGIPKAFTDLVATVKALVHGDWHKAWVDFKQEVVDAASSLRIVVGDIVTGVQGLADKLLKAMGLDKLADAFHTYFAGARKAMQGEIDIIIGLFSGNKQKVAKGFGEMFSGLAQELYGILKAIPAILEQAVKLWVSIFKGLGDKILEATGLGFLKNAFNTYLNGIKDQIQGVMKIIHGLLTGDFTEIKNGIVQVLKGSGELIAAPFLAGYALIKKGALAMANAFGDWIIGPIKNAAHRAADAVGNAFGNLKGVAAHAVGVVVDVFRDLPGRVGGAIAGLSGKILGEVKQAGAGAFNAAKNIGENIIHGIIQGLKNLGGTLKDAAESVIKHALGGIAGALGIHSPSTWTEEHIGEPLAEGIVVGFSRGLASGVSAMMQATAKLTQQLIAQIKKDIAAVDKALADGDKLLAQHAKQRAASSSAASVSYSGSSSSSSRSRSGGGGGGGGMGGGSTSNRPLHRPTGPGLTQERTDMGLDFGGTGPIYAVDDGVMTQVSTSGTGWPGGTFMQYRLTAGYYAGMYVFVAEHVTPAKGIHVGSHVRRGQVIAHAHGQIETGWGSGVPNQTLAAATTGYHEGEVTPAGKSFTAAAHGARKPVPHAAGHRGPRGGGGGGGGRGGGGGGRGGGGGGGPQTTATARQENIAARASNRGGRFRSTTEVVAFIRAETPKHGLDADAVIAVAQTEGGLNPNADSVGDGGTSFGPWQLHAGGELPDSVWRHGANYADNWAWSPEGFRYAFRKMAQAGAKGKTGKAAIKTLVKKFEQPAAPRAEVAKAQSLYKRTKRRGAGGGGGGDDNGAAAVESAVELQQNAAAAQRILKSISKLSKDVVKGLDPDERGAVSAKLKAFRAMVKRFMADGVITDAELKKIEQQGKRLKDNLKRVFEVESYRDDVRKQRKLLDDLYGKGLISDTQYEQAKQQLDKFNRMVHQALKDGVITPQERDKIKAAWEAIGTTNKEALQDFADLVHGFMKDGILSQEDLDALSDKAGEIGGVLGKGIQNAVDKVKNAEGKFEDAWNNLISSLGDLFDKDVTMHIRVVFDTEEAKMQDAELDRLAGRAQKRIDKALASGDPQAVKLNALLSKRNDLFKAYYAAVAKGDQEAADKLIVQIENNQNDIDDVIEAGYTDQEGTHQEGLDESAQIVNDGWGAIIDDTKNNGQKMVDAADQAWQNMAAGLKTQFLDELGTLKGKLEDGEITWEQFMSGVLALGKKYGIPANDILQLLNSTVGTDLKSAVNELVKALQALITLLGGTKDSTQKAKSAVDVFRDSMLNLNDAVLLADRSIQAFNQHAKETITLGSDAQAAITKPVGGTGGTAAPATSGSGTSSSTTTSTGTGTGGAGGGGHVTTTTTTTTTTTAGGTASKITQPVAVSSSTTSKITDPTGSVHIPGVGTKPAAEGMYLTKPALVLAGEAGREWIIPESKIPPRVLPTLRRLFRGILNSRLLGRLGVNSKTFAGLPEMAEGGVVGGGIDPLGAKPTGSGLLNPLSGIDFHRGMTQAEIAAAKKIIAQRQLYNQYVAFGGPISGASLMGMVSSNFTRFNDRAGQIGGIGSGGGAGGGGTGGGGGGGTGSAASPDIAKLLYQIRGTYGGNLYGSRAGALLHTGGHGALASSTGASSAAVITSSALQTLIQQARTSSPTINQYFTQQDPEPFPYLTRSYFAAKAVYR